MKKAALNRTAFLKQTFFTALLCLAPSLATAEVYEIDSAHTVVGFKVRHLGISHVRGSFADFSGTFTFDPKSIKTASTNVSIKTKSIDTSNEKRDDHLRSPDFLDASKHPAITFTSKSITNISGKTFDIVGDLTINGVKKEVVLKTEFAGTVTDPWGNERAGFTASTEIDRKEFGLTWNKVLETGGLVVGNNVTVQLEVEGIKKKKS